MSQNRSQAIAIIGGGYSGVMVAVHLLLSATSPLTIKLIERRPVIGEGIAYSTELDSHLLNVPAGKISSFADDPDHFLRWLQNQNIPAVNADTFVPRKLYSQYIQAILNQAEAGAATGVRLDRLHDEAVSLKTTPESVTIGLRSGEILKVDRVVLALGNLPAANPPVQDPSFYESKRYLSCVWSKKWLTNLSANDPLVLIGAGLTAFDVVVALHRQGYKGTIDIVSRRGLLSQSHKSTDAYHSFLKAEQAPKNIRALVRLVRQEIKKALALGYDWRAVIDTLRPENQAIWLALPLSEQRRFLRHVRTYWDIHRHRAAPEVAQTITELIDAQQVVVHAGRILAYEEDADGVNVVIRHRGSTKTDILRAGLVINCTGSQYNYRKYQHPLIQELLTSGLINLHALNLGLEVAPNGALVDANGNISQQLYTLGPPQIGYLWETTAVPNIRQQAKLLAEELLL
ncbi:MAG: FAD/NAD(P)-binding protein [Gloeotrichia echinulata CP02]